ncbi:MAG: hypothetical protein ACP5N1_03605 [Candidatus Woesearchaeota archaeon]
MGKSALEECIKRLEDRYKRNTGVIEAEASAIESLRSKKDILEFRKRYLEIIKNDLLEGYAKSKNKNKGFYKLITKNYSIDEIAALKFNDNMLYTLGHMFTENVDKWFNHLPYINRTSLPRSKEMYSIMNEIV